MTIKKIITDTKVPIKIWSDDIEDSALDQAIVLANSMPVFSHVVLMPDVHPGKGMPIGGVLPLENCISPNCVGVDIGCGLMAVKTDLHKVDANILGSIFRQIRERIPVGQRGRRKGDGRQEWLGFDKAPAIISAKGGLKNARKQLGTLGGGNHFIEIQQGNDGHIWWMIHSGSRNIGFRVANHYHKLAVSEGVVPNGNEQLAYFKFDSELGQEYYAAMNFCLEFAYQNRKAMSDDISDVFKNNLQMNILEEINIHHNYAVPYDLDSGHQVILHRKGATEATINTKGIIPGSQGSFSYIVKGKGEQESFQSCSHGAGRLMSRTMAKHTLKIDDCVQTMVDFGLKCNASRFALDEAKESYKDIVRVMEHQRDLVDVLVELRPYHYPAIKG